MNSNLALESALEASRKRCGELATALAQVAPDHELLTKPEGYSRAKRLHSIVDAALKYVNGVISVEELRFACQSYEGYWVEYLEQKARLSEDAKKRIAEKRAS